MTRRRAVLACALGAVAAAAVAAAPASPAAPRCPATRATAKIDGVRSCVPLSRVKPAAAPPTLAGSVAPLAFGHPIPLRKRGGGVVVGAATPKRSARAVATLAAAEASVDAAIVAAREKAQAERRETADTATSVTTNPDGSMRGTISKSAATGDGGTVTVSLGIDARPGTGTQEASFDLDLTASVVAKDGSSLLSGIKTRNLGGSKIPDCPTLTGALPLRARSGVSTSSTETFGAGRIKLGSVKQGVSVDVSATADATMGPDARLKPIPITVAAKLDYSRSARALLVFGGNSRGVGTVTISGTMDPVTGALSGASMTATGRGSGFQGSTDAEAADVFRKAAEKIAREQAGRAFKYLREAEANARAGKCTRLTFVPASPSALAPGSSRSVQAQLSTVEGNASVTSARWSATAVRGGVTPTTAVKGSPLDMTVKGATTGPETARINVRAVSAAGISEGTWVGTAGTLPPSYSGTVSSEENLVTQTNTWNGTFTWTKTTEQHNPDGSITGLYALSTASVAQLTVSGGCAGATSGPSGTIVSGDLEIDVSAAGQWTSAFVLDVTVMPVLVVCPPFPPSTVTGLKAFYNSRSPAGLRTMAPNGPLTGAGVTDGGGGGLTTVASWSITPGI